MTAVTVLSFLATPLGYLSITGATILAAGISKAIGWLHDRRRREVSDAELARLLGWERNMWLLTHAVAVIIALFLGALVALFIIIILAMAHAHQAPVPGCPWCDDHLNPELCDCIGPCGRLRCQEAEPGELADDEPRPACPWCDTHACIDRTLCNCAAACGSWLCEAMEASRG